MASRAAARAWKQGRLDFSFDVAMPRFPARPERPQLLPPGRMPKRGRAGSDRSRIALLHALAHIQFVAIDLAWDLVGRFGGAMPRRFTADWVPVAAAESMPRPQERRVGKAGVRPCRSRRSPSKSTQTHHIQS